MFNTKNMVLHNAATPYLAFPVFSALGVRHAFSTRMGGVSEGPYAAMNLSFGRGDSDENVRENYRRFCASAGFAPETLVASQQQHGTNVRLVTARDCGNGIWREQGFSNVDGLITNDPAVTLVTYYADCVPLFFADPENHAVGLAHAGWRGTVAGMAGVMAQEMYKHFGSNPQKLFAAVGPSIGPCCFEVDSPVAEAFAAVESTNTEGACPLVKDDGNGKFHIDLWECNRRILLAAGLRAENISVAELCTQCNPDYLYSHRASGGVRGSLAAFISAAGENHED